MLVWPEDLSERVNIGQQTLDPQAIEINDIVEKLEVPKSAITVIKTLGSGEFGLVQLAELTISSVTHEPNVAWIKQHQGQGSMSSKNFDKIRVAVKSTKEDLGAEQQKQFETEAKLLCALSHPGIVRALAVCFKQQPAFIALELMAGGDLRQYLIDRKEHLQEDIMVKLGVSVICAKMMIFSCSF